jgi:hypothetical protein
MPTMPPTKKPATMLLKKLNKMQRKNEGLNLLLDRIND